MDLTHGPNLLSSMGSLSGLPMASVQLFAGDLAEVGRPGPKVIKAKKLNPPASFHPVYYLQFFLYK